MASTQPPSEYLHSKAELDAIATSRAIRFKQDKIEAVDPASMRALCLSGGGIRSATFAVGIFNSWAKHDGKLLRNVDYLSTVSGGGYAGSFYGRMFLDYADDKTSVQSPAQSEKNSKQNTNPNADSCNDSDPVYRRLADVKSENIQYLRRNGRYLAKSGDEAFIAAGFLLRNFLLLHLLLLSALLPIFSLLHLLNTLLQDSPPGQLISSKLPLLSGYLRLEWGLLLIIVALFLLSSIVYYCYQAKHVDALRKIARLQGQLVLAGCVLLVVALVNMLASLLHQYSGGIGAGLLLASGVLYRFYPALTELNPNFKQVNYLAASLALIMVLCYSLVVSLVGFQLANYLVALPADNYGLYGQFYLLWFLLCWLVSYKRDLINRTSFNTLYSARLRRAYLGAANKLRFSDTDEQAEAVSSYHPADDMSLAKYKPQQFGGPVHLINVTINRTLSPHSKLWQPDRQGLNLAVSSVCAAAEPAHCLEQQWLAEREQMDLAKWLAISGAAVSTGMGVHTKWYTSVILSLFNIRLGYWWRAHRKHAGNHFYTCFYKELTSRYDNKPNQNWYLSDGGHFENLAAYEMIRRRVPRIVIIDAGQDSAFAYLDLANLVRHARIDFNYDFQCASEQQTQDLFGSHFDTSQLQNLAGCPADLKAKSAEDAAQQASKRACLLVGDFCTDKESNEPALPSIYLLYIKPNLTGSEPVDIANYQLQFPDFPHQSTADQFYDEAQWESYRKLGQQSGDELYKLVSAFLAPTKTEG